MKLIFECETELGRCDADRVNGHFGNDPGDWLAFAHTTATLTGSKGMLRIEQHCYLRSTERSDDVRPQSWVKPEMTLEPGLDCEAEPRRMVHQRHANFVRTSREELMEQSIVVIPSRPVES